ncbi:MAG: NAD-dependent epimerase/dehydratase family protein [Puniceicoccales bacterium]|jgi:UDP-glucose 4-epimerase|nr:NAD-dependent epimerase/dehydratase family protein [Puniceicoccales bacterium]
MRILVTGGAGFLGRHCARRLLSIGNDVTVVDNFRKGKPVALDSSLKIHEGDCGDMAFIRSILKNNAIDCVIHLADYNQINESNQLPLKYYSNNFVAMMFLLQAVMSENVKKFIFASSAQVYGNVSEHLITEATIPNPINPYGETKLFCEKMLHAVAGQNHINYAVFRHFDIVGPNCPWDLDSIKNGRAFELFGTDYPTADGTNERDYIHVDDAVEPYGLVLPLLSTHGFAGTYNISTGRSTSMKDVVAILGKAIGREIKVLENAKNVFEPERLVAEPRKAQMELGWHLEHNDIDEIIRSVLGAEK